MEISLPAWSPKNPVYLHQCDDISVAVCVSSERQIHRWQPLRWDLWLAVPPNCILGIHLLQQ